MIKPLISAKVVLSCKFISALDLNFYSKMQAHSILK